MEYKNDKEYPTQQEVHDFIFQDLEEKDKTVNYLLNITSINEWPKKQVDRYYSEKLKLHYIEDDW